MRRAAALLREKEVVAGDIPTIVAGFAGMERPFDARL
jgi:hypothetical protein